MTPHLPTEGKCEPPVGGSQIYPFEGIRSQKSRTITNPLAHCTSPITTFCRIPKSLTNDSRHEGWRYRQHLAPAGAWHDLAHVGC